MAFDLYFGNRKESIQHFEESFFSAINEDEHFPKLNWLWEEFYNSPSIYPEYSNAIVHELIMLRQTEIFQGEYSYLMPLMERLTVFFSFAFIEDELVKCVSD